MEKIFTNIYETNHWGNNGNTQYSGSSGGGSSIEYNKEAYIPFLKNYLQEKNIQKVVDLGCGDCRCAPLLYDDIPVQYIGYDAYKKVIDFNTTQFHPAKYSFYHLDFYTYRQQLQEGDICILKDVLQHWSLEKIYTFLDFLVETKKYKYIFICNCCNQSQDNVDTTDGGGRDLSSSYLPLRKYNAKQIFKYFSKEISVIEL